MCRKGWSDLPPDLLREIAGRLQVAADFVSLHAVCKSWRSSPDLLSGKQLLPWLLAPTEKSGGQSSPLKLRCVFSKSSYRILPPPPYPRGTTWVCSADGATVRYLAIKQLRPTLHDPITGAATDLPCFPYYIHGHWDGEDPRGIVYGDGTVFLFGLSRRVPPTAEDWYRFRAALLLPGEAEWTLVDVSSGIIRWHGVFCAAYHGGRILLITESSCRVVSPDGGADVLVAAPWMRRSQGYWDRPSCIPYILESHGELLCASVVVYGYRSFLLSVHALRDETASAPHKEMQSGMRWVRRKGRRLVDRAFFLGSPNSFAVDASLLCGHGGYAYFVYNDINPVNSGVFRYNLVDGKTEFIEPLPGDWDNHKCTWLVLKPVIASTEEIIEKKIKVQIPKKQQQKKTAPVTSPQFASPSNIYHIHKHYEHNFRVLVRNLPLKVNKSELELFFSMHGKVFSTEIIYHKKNGKTSHGTGIVRMATMHAHQDDALAALDGLNFDGCSIEVILVNATQRRPQRRKAASYI